jgi:DnaJ-class molecular chaperone
MASITNICCAFCHGKGKDPFGLLSALSACQVCMGRGQVTVALPYVSCPACGGSGAANDTRLVCTVCSGKGVISSPKKEHWPESSVAERVQEF